MLEKEGLITPSEKDQGSEEDKMDKARARFLRNSTRLDKKLLGEYISRPDGVGLLKAFIGLFDFSGVSLVPRGRLWTGD
jgi:brefeldin A-resistance guanine nucleotide exchange factor 1